LPVARESSGPAGFPEIRGGEDAKSQRRLAELASGRSTVAFGQAADSSEGDTPGAKATAI